ncbi:hypothetical protein SCP_0600140 [Sparassis crispa]|uniref:non-specific serine/threonine protein kinase n=1 Tax=Sparassis crispa TaxID=139825 RepID=A0A401GP91_9APHY|nr:hypothetical protein SCP_0600140 [Sparassis crispa]GBE84037.1 hypothetical protein SCP_0600140 [Sparassis crispa]
MSNLESDRGAHVVVKIFQESAFRRPEYFDKDDIESGYWRTGAKQARAEALAYVYMRSLQDVKLPHGELTHAHVMEFVDGKPGRLTRLRNCTNQDLWTVMDVMASCLYAVVKCGVVQKDVTCENMIIRPGAAQPVVFVDFAAMQSLRSPSVGPVREPELIEWDVSNDVASLVRAFRKMAVQMSDIAAWLEDRAHRGAPWTRLFAFLTEKMPRWYDLFAIETDEFIALNPEVEQEAR